MAVILSLIMLGLEYRDRHLTQFRTLVSTLSYPLVFLIELPGRISRSLGDALASQRNLLADNNRLFAENLTLRARLQVFETLEKENLRLRSLLDSSFKVGDQMLITELVHVDLNPYRHQIMINKGSRAGVYMGQPALDAHGIMGQVVQVNPWDATLLLITDNEHNLPVEVTRTGLRTIAVGTGQTDSLRLPFLPNNADLQVGDKVVTSGLAGQFPAGYPVATINKIQRQPGAPFTEALATPEAHLDRAREILLVWPGKQQNGQKEEPKAQAVPEFKPDGQVLP